MLERGRYVLGEEVAGFESELADYLGAGFAVGVASGTDALHLALRACGIERGDEVITVAAVATAAAIVMAGADPVFADVDAATLTMDPRSFEARIGPKTRAVVPVHLYGHPATLAEILTIAARHHLKVIERRREIARHYGSALGATALVLQHEAARASPFFHLYVVRSPQRDRLAERLAERGIGVGFHYREPIHIQPAYRAHATKGGLPVTERAAAEVLSLPMYPELRPEEVEEVAAAVREAASG